MVDTPGMRRRGRHAVRGEVHCDAAGGVLSAGVQAWGERARAVPAKGDQSHDGVQVAGSLPFGGRGGLGGSIAPSSWESQPDACGCGGSSGGDPRRASGLGRAQDPENTGSGRSALAVDDHGDPTPARSAGRPRSRRGVRLDTLRTRRAQRPVADGLQGPLRAGDRSLPSADGAGRPLALRPGDRRLRQRTGPNGAAAAGTGVSPLRPASADAVRQRLALGHVRSRKRSPHRPIGLAVGPGREPGSRQGVSSPDPGQDRALPPFAQGRGAGRTHLRKRGSSPGRAGRLATGLQHQAPSRRDRPGHPGHAIG